VPHPFNYLSIRNFATASKCAVTLILISAVPWVTNDPSQHGVKCWIYYVHYPGKVDYGQNIVINMNGKKWLGARKIAESSNKQFYNFLMAVLHNLKTVSQSVINI